MYNAPILPWTDFNNTVVCGGIVLGLVMFFPISYLFKNLAQRYLIDLGRRLSQNRFVKMLRLSWFFEWYFKD